MFVKNTRGQRTKPEGIDRTDSIDLLQIRSLPLCASFGSKCLYKLFKVFMIVIDRLNNTLKVVDIMTLEVFISPNDQMSKFYVSKLMK